MPDFFHIILPALLGGLITVAFLYLDKIKIKTTDAITSLTEGTALVSKQYNDLLAKTNFAVERWQDAVLKNEKLIDVNRDLMIKIDELKEKTK